MQINLVSQSTSLIGRHKFKVVIRVGYLDMKSLLML